MFSPLGVSIVAFLLVTPDNIQGQTNATITHLSPSLSLGIILSTLHFFSLKMQIISKFRVIERCKAKIASLKVASKSNNLRDK